MSANIKNMLNEIDALKTSLAEESSLNEGELRRFRENFMVAYTYDSNAIEGSTLTLSETALVLLEGLTINKKPLRDHLDAIGHKDAFNYIVAKSKDVEPLTERTIKEIHALVFMADSINKGKYREVDIKIMGALDTPPSAFLVQEKLSQLLDSYNADERHPVEKIADFHILFEFIHPFIDGNGRTGRLILNLELIKAGYLPINVKFKDRELYVSCFKDYHLTGKTDKFVEMVAKYELEELTEMNQISNSKKDLINGKSLK